MYCYSTQRENLMTDAGQRMFLRVRDHVNKVLAESGAITMGAAMQGAKSGDSWDMLACVDRMVELGELREIEQGRRICGQERIFVPVGR